MATKSILGRFSEFKIDGIYLFGPMKEKGDALSEKLWIDNYIYIFFLK